MKKVFLGVMLLPGAIMGAGFCSGKEIASYFSKYGLISLAFIPVMFLLYYFIFKLFLVFGKKEKFEGLNDVNKSIFGNKSKFPNFVVFLIYLIFTGAMFAGLFEIGQVFNSNIVSYVLMSIGFVVCYITLIKSFEFLAKLNAVLVPFLIALIVCTCVVGLNGKLTMPESLIEHSNIGLLFFNPIIYACQGLALAYFVLVKVGEGLTKKQINLVALIASFLLVALQALIVIVSVLNPEIRESSMPLLALALKNGMPFDIIYLFTLFLAVLTTLFVTSRSLNEIVGLKVKNKRTSAFVTLAISLIFSVFGFGKIIEWFYPLIGVLGFLILAVVVSKLAFVNFFKFTNKKVHPASKNAK